MKTKMTLIKVMAILAVLGFGQNSVAGPREQAKFMNDRIVGTNISSAEFEQAVSLIQGGNAKQAALNMTLRSDFYNVKLKSFFAPRTNEGSSVLVDFNDYTATLIGIVRDDVPYNQVLSADIIYHGANGVVNASYSHDNNDHYVQLHRNRVDLSNPAMFVQATQSGLAGSPLTAASASGVWTTRAASEAFFVDGTNRAQFRFTLLNYLCRDNEALHDVSRPTDRMGRDVSRHATSQRDCLGCHSGMDAMNGAFAYYNWDKDNNRLEYTAGNVQPKYAVNSNVYPKGYVTTDDSWRNYWRVGPNSVLTWRAGAGEGVTLNADFGFSQGTGAKSLGREIASTKAFSACAVKQVYENVCLKSGQQLTRADKVEIERIAGVFEQQNYNYREIWAEVAVSCMGQ